MRRPPRFNPHRPFGAGATSHLPESHTPPLVSILTGPLGPVQRELVGDGLEAGEVSILTGPLGPVQHDHLGVALGQQSFNPHRPFGAGATNEDRGWFSVPEKVSILTGPLGPVQPPP